MLEVLRFYQGAYEKVGTLNQNDKGIQFQYDSTYLNQTRSRALSVSLPLRAEPFDSSKLQGFFEGLIPEGKTRIELAHRLGVSPSNWLSLLEHLNCECIGALVFKREDVPLDAYESSYQPFEAQQFRELINTPALFAAQSAELSRLSLSGAQAKLGLYHTGDDPLDNWFTPRGLAPSTHIVKIPDENHPSLTVNEFICMQAANICGLQVADCFIIPAERPLFATVRFDRLTEKTHTGSSQYPYRLHQEDFCQACGFPSYGKYEMEETDNYVARARWVLERASSNVLADKTEFTRQVVFDYLIGNCDNHLKNYSLQYSSDWSIRRLAPAYDLVSTTVLGFSRLMGISIGDTRDIDRITRDDWKLFAEDIAMPETLVLEIFDDLSERISAALLEAAHKTHIPQSEEIATTIIHDMEPRLRCK